MEPAQPAGKPSGGQEHFESAPLLPPVADSRDGPPCCPQCATTWPADTILCVKCGINLKTGERIARPPDPAAAEEEPETRLERFASVCPGLFRPRILLLAGIVLAMAAACGVLCLVLLSMGVVMTAATAGAVGLILYAQAVAWLLVGEAQMLVEAMTEFDGPRWNAFILALVIPLTLAFLLIGLKPSAK